MTRPGRPRGTFGDVSRAVLTQLQAESMTVRRLAVALQAPVPVVQKSVTNLKAAGILTKVAEEEVPNRRPVEVVGITHAHVVALEWPRF